MKVIGLEKKYIEALELEKAQLEIAFDGEIEFKESDCLRVYKADEKIVVEYSELCEVYRGFSFVDRVVGGENIEQKAKVSIRGTMIDSCRNGVLNVPSVKEHIINTAAMGYNMILLYVEDIFTMPEYPYFGHKRGAYTREEYKEFVEFAKLFGQELTLHIQTLGHLKVISDWPCFAGMWDEPGILLADEPKTYEFIENEIKAMREILDYNVLFIGMDEAYSMGRGRYLDLHGHVDKVDLFIRHLTKVCDICTKYGFKPFIPSDILIHFTCGGYWSKDAKFSKEIIEKLPKNLGFEYWDYYYLPEESDIIDNMCKIHAESGVETWYCCGAWSWHGITPKNYYSNHVSPNACEHALKYGIDAILDFTFGDDGGECPIMNVLPAILNTAEWLYDKTDIAELNKRSKEVLGISYDDFMKIDALGRLGDELDYDRRCPSTLERSALYNDPMIGIVNANFKKFDIDGKYARDAETLRTVDSKRYGILFETQAKCGDFLDMNWHLSIDIKKAYKDGDEAELKNLGENVIPAAIKALEDFESSFNKQWHKYYKPYGFDVQQMRIGGQLLRLKDSAERILSYANGEIDRMEELEEEDLEYDMGACGFRGSPSWRISFTRSKISGN